MSKLAIAADTLTWVLHVALPVLLVLHAGAIAAYGALTRSWEAVRQILPRNAAILGVTAVLWLASGPLHQRTQQWRYAASYQAVSQVENFLNGGRYLEALKARQAMTVSSPARDALDARIAAIAPQILSASIAAANHGDFVGASALAQVLPATGSLARERDKVVELWAPYVKRQREAGQAPRGAKLAPYFVTALKIPEASYDRLARETVPRASQLDPTATTHIGGRSVHPLAPMLMQASVRARELQGEIASLVAPGAAEQAARTELEQAASQLKRGCEESLSYANSAESAAGERARRAFAEAKRHRANVDRLAAGDAVLPAEAGPESAPEAAASDDAHDLGELDLGASSASDAGSSQPPGGE